VVLSPSPDSRRGESGGGGAAVALGSERRGSPAALRFEQTKGGGGGVAAAALGFERRGRVVT
jgi:hypothetical protein